MPGLEQRQALHQIKQTEITQILDGWAPEAPAAPKPTSAKPAAGGAAPVPTPAASSTSTLYPVVEAAHLPVGKVSMPSEKAPAAPKVAGTAHEVEGISSYTFYTHPGLTFDRVSGTYINDGSTQFNIGSLIPKGATLTEKQVRGFTKLKNILSVYPNDFAGRLGKFNYDENNEIADFVRGVFNLDPSLDDETIISLLLENLQLDTNDYIVAKAYDQNKDYPIFKQGFDDAKTLSNGEPLIMPAKKVSITIGGVTKTSYITTGAFPRPHESDSAFDKYC
jgi:hypothetical protein